MKKVFNFLVVSATLLVSVFTSAQAVNVATIAEAKKLSSYSAAVFTGELTLQYVSIREGGSDYYAFDANNDFIRIRCYNWAALLETTPLKKGDKIKIAAEVTYVNDTEKEFYNIKSFFRLPFDILRRICHL